MTSWFVGKKIKKSVSYRILEKEGNNNNQKKTKKKKDKTKKMSFTGTLDKCNVCDKTVYVVDMLSIEGMPYHKSCFRCTHCKGTLQVHSLLIFLLDLLWSYYINNLSMCWWQMSNYSSMDGVLYCKTHFEQLFKESGNFSKNFQPGSYYKISDIESLYLSNHHDHNKSLSFLRKNWEARAGRFIITCPCIWLACQYFIFFLLWSTNRICVLI